MIYTAHTKQEFPVLRAVTDLPPPPWSDEKTHTLSIKEYPIHPYYKNFWKDGQKVDESEFRLDYFNIAIPKKNHYDT